MRLFAMIAAILLLPVSARAEPVEVDLELLLMVDVSRSMSPAELEIQRRGYAEALRSEEVFTAIRTGMLGRIALAYVEWAGTQHIVVNWRLVESTADLDAFADALTITFNPALRRTSISGALVAGARIIDANEFNGLRRVIDVSGDGPNNLGRPVLAARDAVLAQGITINGLPLLTRDDFNPGWQLDGLDIYYRTCVIGGPGAFVIPVHDWRDFAGAVRRKLVMEIAALAPRERVHRAQFTARDPADCMIGEKIWAERQRRMGP